MKTLIWVLYMAWVSTALVYANTVAASSPYVADLVRLPWDQVAAAASLAFAGGGVAFLTRLNMGQVNPDKLMREFGSDVVTGAISGGTDQTTAALLAVIDIVGNITLQHTAGPAAGAGKFVIKAAADKVLTANVPVLFVACNGNFYEV